MRKRAAALPKSAFCMQGKGAVNRFPPECLLHHFLECLDTISSVSTIMWRSVGGKASFFLVGCDRLAF